MTTFAPAFEIEPFRHEMEFETRGGRPASRGSRGGPKPSGSKFGGSRTPLPPRAWRKRRQTRWGSGGAPAVGLDDTYDTEPASSAPSEHVRWLQDTLNRTLNASLPVDGVMTSKVRGCIRAFQRRNRLPVSGYVGPDTEAALRRFQGGENEFGFGNLFQFELTGATATAESVLAGKTTPIRTALKALGKTPTPGLYRFKTPAGKYYTGKATDLRRRIVQHLWCLTHFGLDDKPYQIAVYPMPGQSDLQVRGVERSINLHHKGKANHLNKATELEMMELMQI